VTNPKPKAVILIGPQGSGKGEQRKKLTNELNFISGEMSAALNWKESIDPEFAKMSRPLRRQGTLVPGAVDVLVEYLRNQPSSVNIAFDGVPRDLDQAYLLWKIVSERKMDVSVIILDLDHHHCIERIHQRVQQAMLNGEHVREDDKNVESIERRLMLYQTNIGGIVAFFESKEVEGEAKIHRISATPSIEEVAAQVGFFATHQNS